MIQINVRVCGYIVVCYAGCGDSEEVFLFIVAE